MTRFLARSLHFIRNITGVSIGYLQTVLARGGRAPSMGWGVDNRAKLRILCYE